MNVPVSRYPVVLVDVGETLIGPRGSYGAVYARTLAGEGFELDAARLEPAIRRTMAELSREIPAGTDRFAAHPHGERGFWTDFATRSIEHALGGPVSPALVARVVDGLRDAFLSPAAWQVYSDVRPALDALRDAGVRMAVVSNWDSGLSRLLERLDLAGYFDALAVSHLEGVEKPNPRLFRVALKRLGARADEALHVGNLPETDLEGARAAGIDALLVDRRGQLDPALGAVADLSGLPHVARHGLAPGRDAPETPSAPPA